MSRCATRSVCLVRYGYRTIIGKGIRKIVAEGVIKVVLSWELIRAIEGVKGCVKWIVSVKDGN